MPHVSVRSARFLRGCSDPAVTVTTCGVRLRKPKLILIVCSYCPLLLTHCKIKGAMPHVSVRSARFLRVCSDAAVTVTTCGIRLSKPKLILNVCSYCPLLLTHCKIKGAMPHVSVCSARFLRGCSDAAVTVTTCGVRLRKLK